MTRGVQVVVPPAPTCSLSTVDVDLSTSDATNIIVTILTIRPVAIIPLLAGVISGPPTIINPPGGTVTIPRTQDDSFTIVSVVNGMVCPQITGVTIIPPIISSTCAPCVTVVSSGYSVSQTTFVITGAPISTSTVVSAADGPQAGTPLPPRVVTIVPSVGTTPGTSYAGGHSAEQNGTITIDLAALAANVNGSVRGTNAITTVEWGGTPGGADSAKARPLTLASSLGCLEP